MTDILMSEGNAVNGENQREDLATIQSLKTASKGYDD